MSTALEIWQGYRFAILAGVLAFALSVSAWLRRDRRLDKMPGPGGHPFIGIGTSLPPKAPARFREWGAQYGEIFKLRVGWYNWVIVNSPEAFRAIMDKQSGITSSKMPAPIGDDVVSRGKRMFTLPYGPKWRTYRGIVHGLVSSTMTQTFVPAQEYETKQLLVDLATDNASQRDFISHVRRFSFSIIMTSTYGNRVGSRDHPDIATSARASTILGKITRAGGFIVDELPFLANLPKWLQPGRKRAEGFAEQLLKDKLFFWRRLQRQASEGKAPMCYAREMMDTSDSWRKQGLTDDDAAWITGGIVEVGSHTSSVTMLHTIRHLAAFPQAQKLAHEELMRVVGPNRTPTYDDVQNLPYIRACVKEVLRLCPTPIFGIKHFSDADLRYKDWIIPKGTVLLANTSFMHYDPDRYGEPYAYKPERYLNHLKNSADYAAMSDPYQRDHFSFGGGRRICPGTRLAENTLHIALANILWAFEVRPPLVNGVEAAMDLSEDAYEDTSFRGPKPYSVRFVPRSEDRIELIKAQWDESKKAGYTLRGKEVDLQGIVSMG